MSFDHKNHYKKLVRDIAEILVSYIDEMPDIDEDIVQSTKDDKEGVVYYQKDKDKRDMIRLD